MEAKLSSCITNLNIFHIMLLENPLKIKILEDDFWDYDALRMKFAKASWKNLCTNITFSLTK